MPFTQKHTKYSQAKSTITYNLHIEIKKNMNDCRCSDLKRNGTQSFTCLCEIHSTKISWPTIFYWSCKKFEYVLLANGGEWNYAYFHSNFNSLHLTSYVAIIGQNLLLRLISEITLTGTRNICSEKNFNVCI